MRRSERSQAIAGCRLERVIGYSLIAPRRSDSAHLDRPWRAIFQNLVRFPNAYLIATLARAGLIVWARADGVGDFLRQ